MARQADGARTAPSPHSHRYRSTPKRFRSHPWSIRSAPGRRIGSELPARASQARSEPPLQKRSSVARDADPSRRPSSPAISNNLFTPLLAPTTSTRRPFRAARQAASTTSRRPQLSMNVNALRSSSRPSPCHSERPHGVFKNRQGGHVHLTAQREVCDDHGRRRPRAAELDRHRAPQVRRIAQPRGAFGRRAITERAKAS